MSRIPSRHGRGGKRRGGNGRSRSRDGSEVETPTDAGGGVGIPDDPSGTDTRNAPRHGDRMRTKSLAPPVSRPWRTVGRRGVRGETLV